MIWVCVLGRYEGAIDRYLGNEEDLGAETFPAYPVLPI